MKLIKVSKVPRLEFYPYIPTNKANWEKIQSMIIEIQEELCRNDLGFIGHKNEEFYFQVTGVAVYKTQK